MYKLFYYSRNHGLKCTTVHHSLINKERVKESYIIVYKANNTYTLWMDREVRDI